MREIKFRQAIIINGKFKEWHYWGFIEGGFVSPATSEYSITEAQKNSKQYTEKKDKNGKEIYEGDITCRHWDNGTFQNGQIIYDEASFLWKEIGGSEKHRISFIHPIGINTKYSEVIGDIYENPELLEK